MAEQSKVVSLYLQPEDQAMLERIAQMQESVIGGSLGLTATVRAALARYEQDLIAQTQLMAGREGEV